MILAAVFQGAPDTVEVTRVLFKGSIKPPQTGTSIHILIYEESEAQKLSNLPRAVERQWVIQVELNPVLLASKPMAHAHAKLSSQKAMFHPELT